MDSDLDVNIGNLWQMQANWSKFLILNYTYFPDTAQNYLERPFPNNFQC